MKRVSLVLGAIVLSLLCQPWAQAQEPVTAEPEAPGQATPAAAATASQAAVLPLVKFSGVVTDTYGQPRTGVVGITFALYQEQEGGSPLWLETQNVELDAEGRYAVLLGAESSEGLPLEFFSTGEARWLEVTFLDETSSLPAAGRPRILLVSVPYALKAADAETLGGKPLSAFVLAQPSGAGTSAVEGEALAASEGTTEAAVEPQQVVSGTTGFLAKFTSSTDLGDSVAFESGGRIGIGTSAGLIARLQVKAPDNLFALNLDSSSTSTGGFAALQFRVNGSNNDRVLIARQPSSHATLPSALYLSNIVGGATVGALALRNNGDFEFMGGKVGIGTGTPTAPLHIVGGASAPGSTLGSLGLGPTASGPSLRLGYHAGGGYSWVQSFGGLPLRINPLGNHVLLNLAGGNVGIGTATPSEKLEVAGTVKATAFVGDGTGLTGLSGWSLTGNSGTTPGTNFLGTTDNVPLELHVNNTRALRLEPPAGSPPFSPSPNVIGGFSGNTVSGGVGGATISGGGAEFELNQVTGPFGTIGGGSVNSAGSGRHATVGGGTENTASGNNATVGGGVLNVASQHAATVPGGEQNTASGNWSFAAGFKAKANHQGAFVWGDSTGANVASTANDQFTIRASGGFRMVVGATPTEVFSIDANGNVEADGDVKFGPSAGLFAPGGAENLRIVRGRVGSTGTVIDGSGFSASHPSTGAYNVSMSAGFNGVSSPVVIPVNSSPLLPVIAGLSSPTGGFAVQFFDTSGTLTDTEFIFIAAGPR